MNNGISDFGDNTGKINIKVLYACFIGTDRTIIVFRSNDGGDS